MGWKKIQLNIPVLFYLCYHHPQQLSQSWMIYFVSAFLLSTEALHPSWAALKAKFHHNIHIKNIIANLFTFQDLTCDSSTNSIHVKSKNIFLYLNSILTQIASITTSATVVLFLIKMINLSMKYFSKVKIKNSFRISSVIPNERLKCFNYLSLMYMHILRR